MPSALLIIDVQQGLCEGEHAPADLDRVVARINAVAARARAAGAPVILIQHEGTSGYLEHGSREWRLFSGLHTEPGDLFVRKTATDSFHRTDLEQLLARLGVTDLVVCGMHTEFCIDTTIRRALALGYPVVLVADGHMTEGNAILTPAQVVAHHNHTLANIESFGPRVRPVRTELVCFA